MPSRAATKPMNHGRIRRRVGMSCITVRVYRLFNPGHKVLDLILGLFAVQIASSNPSIPSFSGLKE